MGTYKGPLPPAPETAAGAQAPLSDGDRTTNATAAPDGTVSSDGNSENHIPSNPFHDR